MHERELDGTKLLCSISESNSIVQAYRVHLTVEHPLGDILVLLQAQLEH